MARGERIERIGEDAVLVGEVVDDTRAMIARDDLGSWHALVFCVVTGEVLDDVDCGSPRRALSMARGDARAAIANEMEIAERRAGWDPNP